MSQATKLFTRLINWAASKWAIEIIWSFDGEEGEGDVRLIRGVYGAYAGFPELDERDVVLLDTCYRSESGQGIHPGRPWAVHIYGQDDLEGDPKFTELYYDEQSMNECSVCGGRIEVGRGYFCQSCLEQYLENREIRAGDL